jgi:hypothetical protein
MTGPVDTMAMSADEATHVRSNLPGAGNFAGKQVPLRRLALCPLQKPKTASNPKT